MDLVPINNQNLILLESVDSTQEEAKRLISSGKIKDNSIIIAEEQSAGKGSYGKSWASPKACGLYMTTVHKIEFKINNNFAENFSAASARLLIQCLEAEFSGCNFVHKPINDVYYDGKKLAGILVESIESNGQSYVLTGIGVNLKKSKLLIKEALPGPPKAPAISLEEIISKDKQVDKFKIAYSVKAKIKDFLLNNSF